MTSDDVACERRSTAPVNWVRDVSFDEYRSQVRTAHSPGVPQARGLSRDVALCADGVPHWRPRVTTNSGGGAAVTIEVETQGPVYEVEEISLDDGRRMLDEAARQYLSMSGDEFVAAWDEDRFTDSDSLRVQQVAALLPFGR